MAGSKFGKLHMKTNGPPPVCVSKSAEDGPSEINHGVLGSVVATLPAAAFPDNTPHTVAITCRGALNANHVEGIIGDVGGAIIYGTIDWVPGTGIAEVAILAQVGGAFAAIWQTGQMTWDTQWPMRYNGVNASDAITGTTIQLSSSVS